MFMDAFPAVGCRLRWPRIDGDSNAGRREMLQACKSVGAGITQSYTLDSHVLCMHRNECAQGHTYPTGDQNGCTGLPKETLGRRAWCRMVRGF